MMIVERPIPKSKWPVHLIGRGVVQHHHHQGKSLFSLSPSHSSSPLEGVGDVKNDNGNERSSQTRVKLFMSSAIEAQLYVLVPVGYKTLVNSHFHVIETI